MHDILPGFAVKKVTSHVTAGIYNHIDSQNITPKILLTVRSDGGASKDLLRIYTAAFQRSNVVSEVPQCHDCVWGVGNVWQAFIYGYLVQCPENFARDTWSLAHYLGIGPHFNVLIFRDNVAGGLMLTCRKWSCYSVSDHYIKRLGHAKCAYLLSWRELDEKIDPNLVTVLFRRLETANLALSNETKFCLLALQLINNHTVICCFYTSALYGFHNLRLDVSSVFSLYVKLI